ncbi:MAG: LysE family translocator [Cyanothece sp. SIO2G6]|nr:LysE family translocator [Cyanothece sp. SIO2G6]
MTLWTGLSLFAIMVTLAALPSSSVVLVVTRSATLGLMNGMATVLGIVVGDILFVILALLGMSILAQTMGIFFVVVKYVAGFYLIWVGMRLLRAKSLINLDLGQASKSTLFASFMTGFLLTIGDVKAIVFYASLFPTLVDMTTLNGWDIAGILLVTVTTVGGVKLVYAIATQQIIERLRQRRVLKGMQRVAGTLMIGAGTYLIVKT